MPQISRMEDGDSEVQASLKIGQPGDKYEQEADAVADSVMRMPERDSAQSPSSPPPHSSTQISPRIQRRLSEEQVESAVDTIMDGLSGYTSASDSASMLAQIGGKSPPDVNSIIRELKSRAGDYGETSQSMVDWYLEDLTAEDRLAARTTFIRAGIPDILRIVAKEIHEEYLSGYTSDSDSAEIKGLLFQFEGNQLDNLLRELESQTGKNSEDTAEWLFDDMTRLDAEAVRLHTINSGSTHALRNYGAWITAKKIEDLVAGYTSHADSGNIKGNFQRTPEIARGMVLFILDGICRTRWSQSAEDAIMEDMDASDYEALRTMGGLTLRAYDYERSWLEKLVSGAEWIMVGLEYLVCGIAGIITGVLSVVWDFVVAIWDLLTAVYHLMGCLLYVVTGGASGSESLLKVKQFFKGLAEMFKAPGELVAKIWDEFWLDIDLIEGPFTDCRRAEYFMRKWVNLIVNVILIFVGGYGLLKGGMSGVKAVVQIIKTAGWRKGLAEIGSLILQGSKATLTGLGDDVVRVVRGLQRPVSSFGRIRSRITLLQQAAREEGYWRFLRRQASESLQSEREFWEDYRQGWADDARTAERRLMNEEGRVQDLSDNIADENLPADADSIVDDVDTNTRQLEQDVDSQYDDVVTGEGGNPVAHDGETGPNTVPASEIDELAVRTVPLQDGHEVKFLRDGRIFLCSDPCEEVTALRRTFANLIKPENEFDRKLVDLEDLFKTDPDLAKIEYNAIKKELEFISGKDFIISSGGERILPTPNGNIVIEGNNRSRLAYDGNTDKVIGMAEIDNEGFITFAIYLKSDKGARISSIHGRDIFNALSNDIRTSGESIKGLKGIWNKDSDNTASFNKAILNGYSPEKAALEQTFTGKMAREQGYSSVSIVTPKSNMLHDGTYSNIVVKFEL